jgi:hypothetical protein
MDDGEARQNAEANAKDERSKKRSERRAQIEAVIKRCVPIYARMYREEVTVELLEGYRIGLGHLDRPILLDRAFTRAMGKAPRFRPDVAQVLDAYEIELQLCEPAYRGYEEERTTPEERGAWAEQCSAKLREALGLKKA